VTDLAERLEDELHRHARPRPAAAGLLVALSGGLDSTVLLHLLRFELALPEDSLAAAHLDHGMRPSSGADADWVRGLTRAWRVPCRIERLDHAPGSEEEARNARYAFLERARADAGAAWILTAHHADDQVETVLFRIARGTGLAGLAGIPAVDGDRRLLRPLLGTWREEIRDYAGRARVPFREDPTNLRLHAARNVLRHQVIPLLEAGVAAGTRRSVARLARLARSSRVGWDELLDPVEEAVVSEASDARVVLSRERWLDYGPEVRAALLRRLLGRLGCTPSEAGTRTAMQFTSSGVSGTGITLARGITLSRDFDHLVLDTAPPPATGEGCDGPGTPPGGVLSIPSADAGRGSFRLERCDWIARWSPGSLEERGGWQATLDQDRLHFPLTWRRWRPGDRIRLSYGTKKAAKLFAEARIPADRRRSWPVLADAGGSLLWIPGVAVAECSGSTEDGNAFTLAIDDVSDH